MRCPQSGNGCPLFVFLRRFVFFLSKRKKVFKKFKKSFEKAEEAPPAGRGREAAFGAGFWAGFCKKAAAFVKIRGAGAAKGRRARHKKGSAPAQGGTLAGAAHTGPSAKKAQETESTPPPSGRRPMPAVRRASFAPCRQPLQGRCRKRPARQEASPAAFTAGRRQRPGACRAAGGSRPGARREARRAPGRLRRAAAPRLRAPPAPRRRYRRLPRCARKTPASRGRRPP